MKIGTLVRNSLVTSITGDQLAMREAIEWKLGRLRAELAQSSDGPLERLLVERMTPSFQVIASAIASCSPVMAVTSELRTRVPKSPSCSATFGTTSSSGRSAHAAFSSPPFARSTSPKNSSNAARVGMLSPSSSTRVVIGP